MKKLFLSIVWLFFVCSYGTKNSNLFALQSPAQHLTVKIHNQDTLWYEVFYKTEQLTGSSEIGLQIEGKPILGTQATVQSSQIAMANRTVEMPYGEFE